MRESLAWLDSPQAAPGTPALLAGLIADIRRIVMHPDLQLADKLAEIIGSVDLLAPPPGPGESGLPAAAAMAAVLAEGTTPVTLLFEQLAGEPVRAVLAGSGGRELTRTECLQLLTPPGTEGHQRDSVLQAARSGQTVAEVTALVLPGRLPEQARADLGLSGGLPTGVPLGKVLAGFGVRREPLGARVVPGAVVSCARLWLGNLPVALASERVPAELCQALGGGTETRTPVGRFAGASLS